MNARSILSSIVLAGFVLTALFGYVDVGRQQTCLAGLLRQPVCPIASGTTDVATLFHHLNAYKSFSHGVFDPVSVWSAIVVLAALIALGVLALSQWHSVREHRVAAWPVVQGRWWTRERMPPPILFILHSTLALLKLRDAAH